MTSFQSVRGPAVAVALIAILCAPSLSFAGSSCGSSADASTAGVKAPSGDIVETAIGAGSFETLVAAVKAAGLVDVLRGDGPFTVFAPTDEAFGALPAATLANLLLPENREQLVAILTYHVVAGEVPASVAVELDEAETVEGRKIDLDFDGQTLTVDGARVVQADVKASNGVIHVIDRVLIPAERDERMSAAQAIIDRAIARGAPLFNAGQPAACTAVYQTAIDGLLALDELGDEQRATVERALRRSDRASNARDAAWVLRRALDSTWESLGGHRMAMND